MRERAPHILERWADAQKKFRGEHRKTHDVRGFLGVESFGINAFEAHQGELLIVPTTSSGRVNSRRSFTSSSKAAPQFTCDREEIELSPGEVLFVRPSVKRQAIALESPTLLLIVGGRPGKPYSPPI